jgi:hypothetical protein
MQTDIVTDAITVAKKFGNLVAVMDYPAAHALLTVDAQKVHPSNEIRWTVESMTASMAGTIRQIECEEALFGGDLPGKQAGDIASVRMRLVGDVFEETVTVVLAREAGAIRIRDLKWGRPLSLA